LKKEKEKKEVIIDECKIFRDLFYRKISELFFSPEKDVRTDDAKIFRDLFY
jgi:hypothetical protein